MSITLKTAILAVMMFSVSGCSGTKRSSVVAPARSVGTSGGAGHALVPPVASKRPKSTVIHGDERIDFYTWLQDKGSPEVMAYLEAENAYADAVTRPVDELKEQLYREILGRIEQTEASVPVRKGDYYYYSRIEEGKQYPIHCRKRAGANGEETEAAETVILDLNELAEGQSFMALGALEVSNDGNLLAYTTDTTGFRDYTLYVLDLRTGTLGPERIPSVKSVAWAADNRTLFYTVDDHAKRPYRLYRHQLGTDQSRDALLLEETDERFRLSVWQSRSKQFLFALASSHTTSEARYLAASDPGGSFRLMAPRQQDIEYYPDHRGDLFYIRTNDTGRNFRVVTTPIASPGRESWKELIGHRADVMLTGFSVFESYYAAHEREAGLPHVRIGDLASGAAHRISFPEAVYAVAADENPELRTDVYRLAYQSLTRPSSVFAYHVGTRKLELLKETKVLRGYDRNAYQAERIHATAADGSKIPISLVYKKGTPLDGTSPLLLQGYGAYGVPYSVSFTHGRVSLLDRGVIVAIAHVRGGSDLGKAWHDGGRMFAKKNTFTDFIAAAEHLIAHKYTSKDRLAISGRSAGGLLIGAVLNLRPDLFRVAMLDVPFVDVLNTMLNDKLPLTVGEFEEWGNPKIPEQYEYMKSYCPYTNIEAKEYPTVLVTTAFNDSQVMYWEPAKYVAKLRAHTTSKNPVVFWINMDGGHGGSSGRYDKIREVAFEYAFLLGQLGIRQ